MSVKRILEHQLHLHDEGNPAWGEHTNFYDGNQEGRDIDRLSEAYKDVKPKYQSTPKNFVEELKSLSKEYVSPKLEGVKDVLRSAAVQGVREVNLGTNQIDGYIIKWLEKEGIKVERKRSGTTEAGQYYYEISW